jgi:hypothetical protein
LGGGLDVEVARDAYSEGVGLVARVVGGSAVQVGEPGEAFGLAEDREVERQTVASGAHDTGGSAADGDPHRQLRLDGPQ